MDQRQIERIQAFVRQSPVLHSSYLLFVEGQRDFEAGTLGSFFAFTIWFMVHGRREFRAPAVIDDELRSVVATLDPRGCHPLMHYLAQQNGLNLDDEALRAWYYCEGVPQTRMAGCLSRPEIAALGRSVEGDDRTIELDRLAALRYRTAPPPHPAFIDTLGRLARRVAPETGLASVTVVGLHRSVLGIGEDARCLFDCLCEAGIVADLLDVSPPGLERHESADDYAPFETATANGAIVIFCLPAFEMMRAIGALNLVAVKHKQHWIGYWPWETTALPEAWRHVYDHVDEIWASSRFLVDVYSAGTTKPVIHMPLHIRVEEPVVPEDVRSVFDGRFSFLSIFDFNSRIERKNPLGSILAFRQAFPPAVRDVQLVLKTLHGNHRPKDLERIVAAIGDDRRIVIIDGALPKAELCGLITLADVYLSLHRSEGFGRPLAEAMLLETPVIATGWSGSADFLNPKTGFPIRSTLRPVLPGEYAFAAGEWAEPDLDHAAACMRDVHAQPATAEAMLLSAKYSVEHRLGRRAIAGRLIERLLAVSAALTKPTPFRARR